MTDSASTTIVPRDEAMHICAELQAEHRRAWYKPALWQCWGCARFSKGDPAKMCGSVVACNLVVARYRHNP
jgi:hypothetical protein